MSTCSPGSQTSSCGSYPEPAMKCDTRGSPPTATSVPSQCAVSPTDCAGGGPTGEQCFFFSTEMANEASLEVEKHKFDSLVSWYFVNHGRYKVPHGGTTQPNQTSLEENADSSASRKRKLEDSLTSTDASDSKRRQTASVEPVLNLEASAIHSPTPTTAAPPPTLSSSASVPAFVQMGQAGQENPLRKPDGPADAAKRDENPLTRMEQMTRLTSFNANSITQLVDQPSSSKEQLERERKMDKLGQIEGQLLSGGAGEEGGGASGGGEDKAAAKTEWDNMLMQHQVKKMMDGQQQQQPGSVPPPPATSSAQPSPVPGGPRSVGPPTGGYPHPGSVPPQHHPLTPTYAHPFPPGPASAGAYPTGFPGAAAGGGKGPYPGPGGYPGFPGGAVPPGMSPGAYPHLPPGHPLRQNPAAYPLHHQHMMMMSRAHPAALSPGAPHPIFTAAPRASSTPMSPLFPPAHPAMRGAAPPPYPGYPGHPGMPGMHPGMMGPMPGMPGMPMGPGGPGGPAMTPQQQQQAAMHHHHQMMMMQHQQQQHQQHQQRQAAAAAAAAAGGAGGQAAMPASATQAPAGEQSWMSALQRPGMPQPGPSPGMMTGPSPGGMPAAASPMGMGPSPMNAMMYGPGSVGAAAAASPATPQQA